MWMYFQHHSSSLQCHVIFQKSFSYSDLLLKKHLLLVVSMLKSVVLHHIFVGKHETEKLNFKEQNLFEIEIFCNIRNLSDFTITFDQFNVSLLNKLYISSSTEFGLWYLTVVCMLQYMQTTSRRFLDVK